MATGRTSTMTFRVELALKEALGPALRRVRDPDQRPGPPAPGLVLDRARPPAPVGARSCAKAGCGSARRSRPRRTRAGR